VRPRLGWAAKETRLNTPRFKMVGGSQGRLHGGKVASKQSERSKNISPASPLFPCWRELYGQHGRPASCLTTHPQLVGSRQGNSGPQPTSAARTNEKMLSTSEDDARCSVRVWVICAVGLRAGAGSWSAVRPVMCGISDGTRSYTMCALPVVHPNFVVCVPGSILLTNFMACGQRAFAWAYGDISVHRTYEYTACMESTVRLYNHVLSYS